ncbi:hypothetical protein AAVH_41336, partial [Aphelenchoides avenae]
MTSNLSPSAIQRIIFLAVHDDRPTCTRRGLRPTPRRVEAWKTLPGHYTAHLLDLVSSKWYAIYRLYRDIEPTPALDYLDSLELSLVLKDEVDDADVSAIFACGRPLQFWGCPRLIVSKIVEAFSELQEEPTYLDVTITALCGLGVKRTSEAWTQVYRSHLPCYSCTTVEAVEERSIPLLRYP